MSSNDDELAGGRAETEYLDGKVVVHRDEPGLHMHGRDCWCKPGVFDWWAGDEAIRKWQDEQAGIRRN